MRNTRLHCALAQLMLILGQVNLPAMAEDAGLGWGFECGCLQHRLEGGGHYGLRRPAKGSGLVWNEATGSDSRNWPPSPMVNYEHVKIALRFADVVAPEADAVATYTVRPIGVPVESLKLNADGLKIASVKLDGAATEFYSDGKNLTMKFAKPLPSDKSSVIEVGYSISRPTDGMTFSPPIQTARDMARKFTPKARPRAITFGFLATTFQMFARAPSLWWMFPKG